MMEVEKNPNTKPITKRQATQEVNCDIMGKGKRRIH